MTITNGKFHPSEVFTVGETVSSTILTGFEVKVDDVFKDVYQQN